MKTVMISIKPKWVVNISIGKKTIEIRKSMPKCDVPFRCLIYCTKENGGCGKVVGEFVCDKIGEINKYKTMYGVTLFFTKNDFYPIDLILKESCLLDKYKLEHYLKGKVGYAWHISNLKIYDKPKDITEYHLEKQCSTYNKKLCDCMFYGKEYNGRCKNCIDGHTQLTRPPQSWCYIEEI